MRICYRLDKVVVRCVACVSAEGVFSTSPSRLEMVCSKEDILFLVLFLLEYFLALSLFLVTLSFLAME